jgi:FMN phosphatase YigB (HAD superfamily)
MKAIFFDADGVLYERGPRPRYLETFLHAHRLPVPPREAIHAAAQELKDQATRGQVPPSQYYDAILAACGVADPALLPEGRKAIEEDRANIILFPCVQYALGVLKERGFKLGIITDASVPQAVKLTWLAHRGLSIAWDAYANSMDLGVRKPDPLMYQTAMQQAGVTPAESVFVGHATHELVGARQVGMRSVAVFYDPDAKASVAADDYLDKFVELLDLPFLQQAG